MLTDVQTPFLGTPEVPLKIRAADRNRCHAMSCKDGSYANQVAAIMDKLDRYIDGQTDRCRG